MGLPNQWTGGQSLQTPFRARGWDIRLSEARQISQSLPQRQMLDRVLAWSETQSLELPQTWLQQIHSLRAETDPELFAAGVLVLAHRLGSESEDCVRLAAGLYQGLIDLGSAGQEEAQRSLAVLQGEGSFANRFENFSHHFLRQTLNPTTLLSFGIASGVSTLARAGILSRLVGASRPGLWTQVFGARTLAGLGAFAFEVPSFVLAENGLRALGGERVSLSAQEWASTALNLGLMKFAHFASSELLSGYSVASLSSLESNFLRFSRVALPPLASFTGILGARVLESELGIRPISSASSALFDSFGFFLQAHLSNRVMSGLMGPAWESFQQDLELRSRLLPRLPWNEFKLFPEIRSGLALAGNLPGEFGESAPKPWERLQVFNQALTEGEADPPSCEGSPKGNPLRDRLEQWVRPRVDVENSPRLPKDPNQPKIRRIGILTSGGDGPAENAAIAALVRGAIELHGWEALGIWDGFKGLLEPEGRIRALTLDDVQGPHAVMQVGRQIYGNLLPEQWLQGHQGISTVGGDFLRSSRTNPLLGDPLATAVKSTMLDRGIDGLIILGGNGSLRATAALHEVGVPVVFLPQSIDADVPGSELSIGFPSAVAKGASLLRPFYHTGQSCDRWFFVEIMGQHYGALALSVAREARADWVFTELPRPMNDIPNLLATHRASGKNHGVILISESVQFRGEQGQMIQPPRGVDKNGRLLVESGDIARWISHQVTEMGIPHTRSAALGYLLRGADPSPHDIHLAEALAGGALNLVEAGQWGRMAGVRFISRSGALKLSFPEIARVARQSKRLPQELQDFVLANLGSR